MSAKPWLNRKTFSVGRLTEAERLASWIVVMGTHDQLMPLARWRAGR